MAEWLHSNASARAKLHVVLTKADLVPPDTLKRIVALTREDASRYCRSRPFVVGVKKDLQGVALLRRELIRLVLPSFYRKHLQKLDDRQTLLKDGRRADPQNEASQRFKTRDSMPRAWQSAKEKSRLIRQRAAAKISDDTEKVDAEYDLWRRRSDDEQAKEREARMPRVQAKNKVWQRPRAESKDNKRHFPAARGQNQMKGQQQRRFQTKDNRQRSFPKTNRAAGKFKR